MNPTIKKYITFALLIGLGLLIGWFLFGGTPSPNMEPGSVEEEVQPITWTCSMDPQIRQSEPGDCPICGMDLIPLEVEAEDSDPMAIKMSKTAMQLANVQTITVSKTNPVKKIALNGKLAVDERLRFTQSSHIPGRIEQLKVNFTGDFITKGQVIALVYSPELVVAQEELFEAREMMDTQPRLFEATKEKLKNWRLTEAQIQEILDSGKPKERFPILADVSGYVTEKFVNLGDYISIGQPIYEISNLSKMWVLFDVYESDLAWVKKGDQVTYTIKSYGDEEFTGSIGFLDPVIDPQTRVAKARLVAQNPKQRFKPEMFVTGTVESNIDDKTQRLTVPKSAVLWTGKRSVVYVKISGGQGTHFKLRKVELGPSLGDGYIIMDGLNEGEEIASNGAFSIDAAAQLAGKPSMMNPEGNVVMTGHNHGGDSPIPASNSPSASPDFPATTSSKKTLTPLLLPYIGMKDALAGDNFDLARQEGGKLRSKVNSVVEKGFPSGEKQFWQTHEKILQAALEHLDHMNSIDQLRTSFIEISNSMIAITEAFHLGSEGYYIQHCPMANGDKGADWISKEQEILNPYFGASMLKCGEVIKTLK